MSVLGDRYEYDVFFSYAWAAATDNPALRDWTRAVADATTKSLSLRFNGKGKPFNPYLDRDQSRIGQDLDRELKAAAESTGIFVAFVSDYYNSPYCQKEVEWFCESQKLTAETLADRVCLIRIQAIPDDDWPTHFKDSVGKPRLYKDLCDESGQPKSFENYLTDGTLLGLGADIRAIALDIADKISEIQRLLVARQQYRTQSPPTRPQYFFEAEPTDQLRWAEFGEDLKGVPSIVLPAAAPKPATAISSNDDLKMCDGILMLRSRSDDDFSRRIANAYFHRRNLFLDQSNEKSGSWLRWALLDEVEPPPPEIGMYDIPRVKPEGNWIENLKQAMGC